jgi:hypothetical protein
LPPSQNGKPRIGFSVPSKNTPTKSSSEEKPTSELTPNAASLAQNRVVAAKPVSQRHEIRLADALRREGIDEQRLAEAYADIVERLICKSEEHGVEKLLIDVLKECARLLEKGGTAAKKDSRSGSTMIVVHNVPRPQRGPAPGGNSGPVQ